MSRYAATSKFWWKGLSLDTGQTARLEIGPLVLQVCRLEEEWQVAYARADAPADDANDWQILVNNERLGADADLKRYLFKTASAKLQVVPALADRPVVIRPMTPFYIPSGREATIYVSLPVWLRVQVGDPPATLEEIPVQRLSDTWFGPSTREGELCYASRTHGRSSLEQLPLRHHRAMTAVIIRNRFEEAMLLERLCLPVKYLALFATQDGLLWTQPVTMIREEDGDMAALEIGTAPPEQIRKPTQVGGSRQEPDQRILLRTLSALFG